MLASAALLAWHELERRKALWIAPALLAAAICGLHFTAMGAVTVVGDPSIVLSPSVMSSSTLAVAVTAVAALAMLALLAMTLITSEGQRDALLRNQDLVDAAVEGLVIAKDGIIVNVNRRILSLTLNTPDELLGKKVAGDLVIVAGNLAPSGKAVEGLLKTATGLVVQVEIVCQPWNGSERANEVYAIRDLTERRRIEEELRRQNKVLQEREEELRRQNHRFEVTLANMTHGLCMIDPEQRIVVCNSRYSEMYGLPEGLAKPGTRIADVFAYRVAKGLYSPAEDEEYKSAGFRATLEPTVKTRHLDDGRIILINRRPTGDGGWIAIHEDVTERHSLSERLAEQNVLLQQREAELQARNASLDVALAKLEVQNANLDMALTNMTQGLAMFDAEERLVLANDRYAEIYGLEPQHLRPGTPLRELVEYRIAKGLYPGPEGRRRAGRHARARGAQERQPSRQPAGRRARAVGLDPAARRRRMGGDAARHHRARADECPPDGAEHPPAAARGGAGRPESRASMPPSATCPRACACTTAEQRIVFANGRYAEIYNLTPEQVKPGTTLRQIFEARLTNGTYGGGDDGEKFVRDGLERFGRCKTEVIELSDGRFISVVRRPIPGGGLLTTHEDITERERLNARLARQNELLREREQELATQNTRFDAAIGNMSQGMCLYDSEQRIVFANNRFAELYGLTREQVKPGTTPRQLLEARAANGNYSSAEAANFINKGVASFQRAASEIIRQRDGRFHLHRAPAHARRRPAQHARGHQRARAAERPPGAAEHAAQGAGGEAAQQERPARCRPQQHAAGPRHVRQPACGSSCATSAMPRCTASPPSR